MKNNAVAEMEKLFLALADKTRLRLLKIIGKGEVNVNALVKTTGESQPKISRHLAVLRNAGLVELRRDGKWAHYKIAAPSNEYAATVLEDALEWLGSPEGSLRASDKINIRRSYEEETQTNKDTAAQSDVYVKTNIRENRELEIHLL